MIKEVIKGTILSGFIALLLFSISFADDAFDRELVVKDQTRVMKVEAVFKKLLQAYEDESPNDFLALVSDERFRQDYISFTDALYSDFRKYEIKDVTYWIDRVTSDHVKQFLYVKWEKRYINLDDGRPGTTTGFSRFLFDEVNGKYLLVELAGNSLFGASLQEWRDEVPRISGEVKVAASSPAGEDCSTSSLGSCVETNCASVGGYWYNNQCNSTPQSSTAVCDSSNLNLCDEGNCSSAGGGFWANGTCYGKEQEACEAMGNTWDGVNCNKSQPDLFFGNAMVGPANGSITIERFSYTIANRGTAVSGPCVLELSAIEMTGAPRTIVINDIGPINAGDEYSGYIDLVDAGLESVRIVPDTSIRESDESNNEWVPTPSEQCISWNCNETLPEKFGLIQSVPMSS